jgi:hypothetical protein
MGSTLTNNAAALDRARTASQGNAGFPLELGPPTVPQSRGRLWEKDYRPLVPGIREVRIRCDEDEAWAEHARRERAAREAALSRLAGALALAAKASVARAPTPKSQGTANEGPTTCPPAEVDRRGAATLTGLATAQKALAAKPRERACLASFVEVRACLGRSTSEGATWSNSATLVNRLPSSSPETRTSWPRGPPASTERVHSVAAPHMRA